MLPNKLFRKQNKMLTLTFWKITSPKSVLCDSVAEWPSGRVAEWPSGCGG